MGPRHPQNPRSTLNRTGIGAPRGPAHGHTAVQLAHFGHRGHSKQSPYSPCSKDAVALKLPCKCCSAC